MKRSTLTMLGLLIIISVLLVACGTKTEPTEMPDGAAQATEPAETTTTEETSSSDEPIEIEFWYIPFTQEEEAHRAVIDAFEAANPDVKVKEVLVQYEEITQKVAAQVPVGQGPDVIKPYYGWVPLWRQNGFLAPLPEDRFPAASMPDTYVAIDAMNINGEYYGIPSTISVWALFYNKDAFAEAGIENVPTTWDELREAAIQCTKRDADGNLERAGYFIDPGQQEHIVWKILQENFGQPQFGDDKVNVQWNASETGYEAFEWFVNLILEDEVSEIGFAEAASVGFQQGVSCMNLGAPSWISRIETNNPDLNYGIAPYICGPADDPTLACRNLGQYWSYSLTTKAAKDPAVADASARFIEFLGSPEGVKAYTDVKSGLPPRVDMLDDPAYADDPNLIPFLATIEYAKAIPWVDELGERDISLQMLDRIFLNGEDPREVLDWGAEQNNALRQEFFANDPGGAPETEAIDTETETEVAEFEGEPTEIEFWYIPFTQEEEAHRAVIDAFEAANPDVTVKEVLVQYEEITQKVAAQVPVGQGPDVIKPYYGWVPLWRQNGFLAPLPEDLFPAASMPDTYVAIDAMDIDGQYYGIPSTISVWALFYNKDAFAEAGIENVPTTWDELREAAIQCTKRDADGNLERAGYFIDPGQQEHIVWKILLENFGQQQFDADGINVQWNASETGYEAFEWFVNLILEDEVSEIGFAEAASVGFQQGVSCMNLGAPSWISRIETNNPDLNYGIAPYICGPADDDALACRNLGQYWAYSLTTKAAQDPVVAEASARFIAFLGSPEGVKAYTDVKSGLPPRVDLLDDPAYADDPNLIPFLATIEYAKAIPWVDELGERDISLQMLDRIFLADENPREVLDWGAEQTNELRQEFFANN